MIYIPLTRLHTSENFLILDVEKIQSFSVKWTDGPVSKDALVINNGEYVIVESLEEVFQRIDDFSNPTQQNMAKYLVGNQVERLLAQRALKK